MKLKTAALLACIGFGISVLPGVINLIRYHILERNEYLTLENDIYSVLYLLGNVSLLVFLIVFYKNQDNKSWKD